MRPPQNRSRLLHTAIVAWLVATAMTAVARQEAVPVATNLTENIQDGPLASPNRLEEMPEAYRRNHQEYPVFFNDYVVESGTTNYGDAVTFKGSSTINGTLMGSSVTLFGDAIVNGNLRSDLLVIMGPARLGPEARVGKDVVVLGGKLTREPGATIGGQVLEIDPEKVPGLPGALAWIMQGLLLGRPLPLGVGWAWMVAGALLLVNFLVMVLFPGSVQSCLAVVEKRPVSSFFSGTLALMLSGLLVTLLIISVAGLLVLPFLLVAMLAAFVLGKIAVYRFVGQQLGNQAGLKFLTAPAIALVVGTAIFYLLYAVPILGFVGWGFTCILGMGAAMMAAIQKLRGEQRRTPAVAIVAPAGPVNFTGTSTATPSASGSAESPEPLLATAASPLETSLLAPAGFWLRLCALGLDLVLFLLLAATIRLLQDPGPFLVLWAMYHVALWTWRGSTIGGLILGIKVVTTDGRPLTFMLSLIRALASVFSAAALGLGFFWAGFRHDKRSWHDLISGTILVKGR